LRFRLLDTATLSQRLLGQGDLQSVLAMLRIATAMAGSFHAARA